MGQHHTKVHGDALPNRACAGSGIGFYDPKAQRKYCDECNPNAGEHNGNWKGGKENATCTLCGEEFSFYPSEKEGVYCPECVTESNEFLGIPSYEVKDVQRIQGTCRQCGDDMTILQSEWERGRGRFCSHECVCLWMSKSGARTYNRGWFRVRRLALERDNHTCQNCGKTRQELGREPDVHHKVPVRLFDEPQDAHTRDNVVSLCRRCRTEIEWKTARHRD